MSVKEARARRLAIAAIIWLGMAMGARAQTLSPPSEPASSAGVAVSDSPAQNQEPPPAVAEYPSLHLSGFADVGFSAQSKSEGARGFTEGQFVLHLVSALSPQVNFFGELSLSPRADAGTGMPAATGYNAEVERAIIRFDQSDRLKVSFGRYHTPINWWNTAFHHGAWLQTTISRPEMTQFGGRFIPVHFVGALVEGSLPAGSWHFGYQGGLGNGRGNVISRAGDAGDNNDRLAWLVGLSASPDRWLQLQIGASLYMDRISATSQPEYGERILAAHAVWQREDPEIIAEIADVRHRQVEGTQTTSNLAWYLQAAYRLPGAARLWKPYYRFEHIAIDAADPVFAGTVPPLDGSTIGVRFDISTYVAVKAEARTRSRVSGQPRTNGGFLQVAFTF